MSTTTQCPHKLAASTISSIAASVVNNIVATTVGDPHAGHIGHHGQDKMMPADHSNHGTHDDMMMVCKFIEELKFACKSKFSII